MVTLYRISDGGYKKDKLPFADKFYCLDNYLKYFDVSKTILFADNCKDETLKRLESYSSLKMITSNEGSSAQSWRMVAKYAFDNFSENENIYFLEDDYLHLPLSFKVIEEGLEIADYVTLYDHPDKYINAINGGNPLISNGGEKTILMLTKSSHWKITNSTTMTFACKLKTLQEDWAIWDIYTQGTLPSDDLIFYKLQSLKKLRFKLFGKNRKLVSSVPGLSTHIETRWLSPIIDWENA